VDGSSFPLRSRNRKANDVPEKEKLSGYFVNAFDQRPPVLI
jgi:hypothetical protein